MMSIPLEDYEKKYIIIHDLDGTELNQLNHGFMENIFNTVDSFLQYYKLDRHVESVGISFQNQTVRCWFLARKNDSHWPLLIFDTMLDDTCWLLPNSGYTESVALEMIKTTCPTTQELLNKYLFMYPRK